MDRGTIFTLRIDIMPGAADSFIVRVGPRDYEDRQSGHTFGFTDVNDLIAWLDDHADAFKKRAGNSSADHAALAREA